MGKVNQQDTRQNLRKRESDATEGEGTEELQQLPVQAADGKRSLQPSKPLEKRKKIALSHLDDEEE